ncbi:D-xylose transport system substrate-binding protein [Breznakibacter xylanolyticus]|uniref:D-xylose transport system substrate-binding protein n=1 Tax=Breznakibacter xylanolyticus TaxID=990 RepID=A0A2W7NPI9_9BACT|nr:substrate-binding domain-containing protein [Breznakibacter xylanolyticus]PZX15156.1 D-xylose transport system substrate-binding protein [Breznakibacter xylanolyticus]
MKRNILLRIPLLFTLALVLLSACRQHKMKVGILYAGNNFQADCDEITRILKEQHVQVISANAQLDMSKQIEQARQMIDKKQADVMLIIPVNTNASAEIVRLCKDADIKTVAYERFISNCDLDYYIAFDNIYVGELLAQSALLHHSSGRFAIINGDKSDRNAQWVYQGFMKTLEPHIQSGDIEVVYNTFIDEWSQDFAQFEFDQYLGSGMSAPDVFLSAHNRMSNGIIQMLEKYGITETPIITGQVADTPEGRNAWNPRQQIALFKSYAIESKAAAELVLKILKHEKINIDRHVHNGFKEIPAIVIKDMSLETH